MTVSLQAHASGFQALADARSVGAMLFFKYSPDGHPGTSKRSPICYLVEATAGSPGAAGVGRQQVRLPGEDGHQGGPQEDVVRHQVRMLAGAPTLSQDFGVSSTRTG